MQPLLCTYKGLDLSLCCCTGERLSSIATGSDFVLNGVDWKTSRRPGGNNIASVKEDFIFLKKGNVCIYTKQKFCHIGGPLHDAIQDPILLLHDFSVQRTSTTIPTCVRKS